MALLSLHNITIAFGGTPLLDNISFEINKGQRICILGRNGTGKSTMMKIIAGINAPDSGEVIKETGTRIAYLPQEIPENVAGTVYQTVARGAGPAGELLAELNSLQSSGEREKTAQLHQSISEADGWQVQNVIERVLSLSGLDGHAEYSSLSGGIKRRVFLARALVKEPDLLLLDEPTNHLDIESITWLESFILSSGITLCFVTHDRKLLKRLATRIVELDRGKIFDWSCDYATFLERKQALLDAEEKAWELFDKKLSQEEIWLRKGIKARRTRNEGRVRALKKMRHERSLRRQRSATASMEISEAQRSGVRVLDARQASFYYGDRAIIRDLNITISRGDRIGIIGPNGCGKTTLLNLLLGNISPDKGTIERGTNLQTVYFDQHRAVLDPQKTVWENVAPGGGDTVFVNDSPRHVISYLRDFLFTSDRANSPVKQLSGGERNRLMLARMFTTPSNLLVLDEPTNDLDTETLELLEDLLGSYSGTILVVSHDREFLNNVVTSLLAYEGDGVFKEFIGGYDDLQEQLAAQKPVETVKKTKPQKESPPPAQRRQKRTFREEQEFKALPGQIENWENQLNEITSSMADPQNYKKAGFAADSARLSKELQEKIEAAYKRWEELEEK